MPPPKSYVPRESGSSIRKYYERRKDKYFGNDLEGTSVYILYSVYPWDISRMNPVKHMLLLLREREREREREKKRNSKA